jgi:hypothetical protein
MTWKERKGAKIMQTSKTNKACEAKLSFIMEQHLGLPIGLLGIRIIHLVLAFG